MKPVCFLNVLLSFGLSLAVVTSACRADDGTSLTPSTASLDSIHNAATASEAVDAYAKAIGNVRDPSAAQHAFIVRMIELNNPQLAEAQAKSLTEFAPDGLAWAVMAYASGQRNDIPTAIEQTAKSIKYSPNDSFVQKNAGQLLAWFDAKVEPATVTDSTHQTVDAIRRQVGSQRTFTQAYEDEQNSLTPVNNGLIFAPGLYSSDMPTIEPLEDETVPEMAQYWDSPYLYPGYGYFPVDPYGYGYGGWLGGYYPAFYSTPYYRNNRPFLGRGIGFPGRGIGFPGRSWGPGSSRLSNRVRFGTPVRGPSAGQWPIPFGVQGGGVPARARIGGH